jgi:hypothetical protein
MTDHAVQYLLDPSAPVNALPVTLAQAWPDAASLELGYAIAEACHGIEAMYKPAPPLQDRVLQGWRHAALIQGDVLALQRLDRPHALARHLLVWWQTG